MKIKILIYIDGGLVQGIYHEGSASVEVTIVDHDKHAEDRLVITEWGDTFPATIDTLVEAYKTNLGGDNDN